MTALTMYLNQPSVMQSLGVRTTQWTACNDTVYTKVCVCVCVCVCCLYCCVLLLFVIVSFVASNTLQIATPDWFNQESYTIPVLLDKYRVMIYAGVEDWICEFVVFHIHCVSN
jgi:hypothetical protein